MNPVVIALVLFGVTGILILDNFRLSGSFIQTGDILDTNELHHEHVEMLLVAAAIFFLLMAV